MAAATGETVKPDQYGKARRNIARVKTVLGEVVAKASGGKV